MSDSIDKYSFLEETIPKIKELVGMKGICCPSVRDRKLRIVMSRMFKHLEIEEKIDKPLDSYLVLKKYILDSGLTDEQKKSLLSKM